MKKNKRMSICCKSCREVLMEELMSKGMLREVIEEKRIVLPYVGVRLGKCESLRYEHGLFVQCSREKILDDNCERCSKEKLRGINYGNVNEREKVGLMDYIDMKGRKVVHYRKVMKKLNINEREVNEECERLGIKLDERHLEEVKSKRGRPRKEVIVSDTDSEPEKKKRGRPRKEKKTEEIKTGGEIIAAMVADQEEKKEEKEEEEEDDETEVCEYSIKGKLYLKSEKNILFDIESHEIIGIWVESRNSIEEYEE